MILKFLYILITFILKIFLLIITNLSDIYVFLNRIKSNYTNRPNSLKIVKVHKIQNIEIPEPRLLFLLLLVY